MNYMNKVEKPYPNFKLEFIVSVIYFDTSRIYNYFIQQNFRHSMLILPMHLVRLLNYHY